MANDYTKTIEKYLTNKDISKDDFKSPQCCFKLTLKELFGCNIDCAKYDQVVNGEGNEKDKISTSYSSSLQSLLFFSGISEKRPIQIKLGNEPITFTKVLFEYKNKVIGYPSSIDVVLVDKEQKNVLFIESKLAEIVRDSKVMTNGEKTGTKEIGISYFANEENQKSSYYNTLKLSKDDLIEIGIEIPDGMTYPVSKKDLSKYSNQKYRVVTIDENQYVYSYGIKQMLSHIIGILNFRDGNPGKNCSSELNDISKTASLYFMELWNDLPNIGNNEIKSIQDSYKKHIAKVKCILDKKNLGITILSATYQKLYEESGEDFKLKLERKIVDYYHLDNSDKKA